MNQFPTVPTDGTVDMLFDLDPPQKYLRFDEDQEIARSSFADMLHDTERNQKYNEALKLAIDKMHSLGKKANVLDIGTGSGLLSMMAVNCGADSVIACEAFEPISRCAVKVIEVNDCADKIKVISKHSTKLTVGEGGDLPMKANILVAEVFDTELIGEGALAAFSHAHKELLESDCIVVPSFAIMYAQIVECKVAQNWNKCRDFTNSDGELLIVVPELVKDCAGSAAVHDLQLSQLSTDLFKQICPPRVVLQFDWSGKVPLAVKQHKTLQLVAETNGIAQMIFMWWELAMDPDNTVTLSCAPYWAHPLKTSKPNLTSVDIPWRDHWLQAIYYLPKEIVVENGQQLNLVSCHDEFSIWFYLETATNIWENHDSLICDCSMHAYNSRTRIGQINDDTRRKKYTSFLKNHVTNESVILVLGDGFYLALIAAKFGAKKLLFIDDKTFITTTLKMFILRNDLSSCCEILEDISCLEFHPNTKDITMILGEPSFAGSILPWENAMFGNLVLTAKNYIKQNVIVAPKECIIKGILVESKDLHKTQVPVEVCGEFDMQPFDEAVLTASSLLDPKIDAHPLWEYPCVAKSKPQILSRLNLENIYSSSLTSFGNTLITDGSADKHYNAIAFWVEWNLDGTEDGMITTGPIVPPVIDEQIQWDVYTKQGIRFVHPKCMDAFYFHFEYDVTTGFIDLSFC